MNRKRKCNLSFLFPWLFCVLFFVFIFSCKTQNDLKREQELEQLKRDVSSVEGNRADLETQLEQLRIEVQRQKNMLEEQIEAFRNTPSETKKIEELQKEVFSLGARVQALEQREVTSTVESSSSDRENNDNSQEGNPTAKKGDKKKPPPLKLAKKLLDEGKYEEAITTLKSVSTKKLSSEEKKKWYFYLADAHFLSKNYAASILELSEFRKRFPSDKQVPQAIHKQAECFKHLNKPKEAKLFYQELMERYPTHPLAEKSKKEVVKLKN